MSDTPAAPPPFLEQPEVVRPWHGRPDPMDALHDWCLAEFAKLRKSDDEKPG